MPEDPTVNGAEAEAVTTSNPPLSDSNEQDTQATGAVFYVILAKTFGNNLDQFLRDPMSRLRYEILCDPATELNL